MSNPHPVPKKAFTLEDANEQLRALLEHESAARIDARAVWSELAKVVIEGDKPAIKRLMLALRLILA